MQMATTIAMVMADGLPAAQLPHALGVLQGDARSRPRPGPARSRRPPSRRARRAPRRAPRAASPRAAPRSRGTVDPQGMATTYRFEYGTSSSYGLQTAEVDAGSGTGAVDASATLTGLTNDTTYHYRVVATNAAGVTRGSDRTLKTDARPGPPGATTGSARNVSAGRRPAVGLGRPQRPRHDLPLRVRHDHELRQAHRGRERRQRAERAQRERRHLGPEPQHALPLPRRGRATTRASPAGATAASSRCATRGGSPPPPRPTPRSGAARPPSAGR